MTELNMIRNQWQGVIDRINTTNRMIGALLRENQPTQLDDNLLTISVGYQFHNEQLNQELTRAFIEDAIAAVIGTRYGLRVVRAQPKAA